MPVVAGTISTRRERKDRASASLRVHLRVHPWDRRCGLRNQAFVVERDQRPINAISAPTTECTCLSELSVPGKAIHIPTPVSVRTASDYPAVLPASLLWTALQVGPTADEVREQMRFSRHL